MRGNPASSAWYMNYHKLPHSPKKCGFDLKCAIFKYIQITDLTIGIVPCEYSMTSFTISQLCSDNGLAQQGNTPWFVPMSASVLSRHRDILGKNSIREPDNHVSVTNPWMMIGPEITVWPMWYLQISTDMETLLISIWISRHPHLNDDVMKWKYFLRYWPFVWGIPRTKASNAELWCLLWSEHSWGWWFETPSRSSWLHCNDMRFRFSVPRR